MAKNVTMNNGGAAMVFGADLAKRLAAGIAESRAQTPLVGGIPLLRLLKSGEWVYGQQDEEVDQNSRWVVNIVSLAHGWSCWVDGGKDKNTLAGEEMVSMADPKPPRPAPIDGTQWAEQRSFQLKCIEGDDAGTEVLYKTGSVGGMRAVDGLLVQIHKRLGEDPQHAFPVLALDVDSYDHKKWGEIFTPIFEVTGWVSMDAQLPPADEFIADEEEEAMQEPEPEKAPRKPRTKRAAKPAPAPAEPPATAQLHNTGQRRRPGPQATR